MPLFECLIIYRKVQPLQIHVTWGHGATFPPDLIPPPSPFPLHDWRSPFQLVAWGRGSPSPWPQSSPPPKHWRPAEKTVDEGWEIRTVGGGGVWEVKLRNPHPSPSMTDGYPSSLWRGNGAAHPPDQNLPPPPQTLTASWEVRGCEMRTVDTYIQLFIPKIHICIYLKAKTIERLTPSYST